MKSAIPGIEWKVIHANLLDYAIQSGDSVFFMFSPFVEEAVEAFLDKLEKSCKLIPGKTYFIYASPLHASVLENRGHKIIFRQSLMNLRGVILVKDCNLLNLYTNGQIYRRACKYVFLLNSVICKIQR